MHYNPCIAVLLFFNWFITNVETETFFKDLRDLCFECDCDLLRLLTESKTQAFLNNVSIVCNETFKEETQDAGFSTERSNVSQQIQFLIEKNVSINITDLRVENLNPSSIHKLMKILKPAIQLRKISIASNDIRSDPKFIFRNSVALEELILPDIRIKFIESAGFSGLPKLKRIFLNDNWIRNFDFDVFEDSKSLEEVNLSGNIIKNMSCQNSTFSHLRNLDLSNNLLNSITFEIIRICFSKFPQLRYLNLSHNNLFSVGEGAFKSLRELRILDLSFNYLKYFSFHDWKELKNLEQLFLQENQLGSENSIFPGGLVDLNLTKNSIGNMETVGIDSLVSLNISHNRIKDIKYLLAFAPKLQELDASWNHLQSVKDDHTFKSLRRLILDGNPLNYVELDLSNFVPLEFTSLSKIWNLKGFYSSNITGIFPNQSSTKCSTLIMSHNPNLTDIFGNFSWTNICKFDLSFNKLTSIQKNLFNWDKVKSINLQGNPLNCNCQLKWMLDNLVPFLLKADPSLLTELRCDEPELYRGNRLVHLYNKSSTFCDSSKDFDVSDSDDGRTGVFITIGCFIVIFTVLLAISYLSFKIQETKRSKEQRERSLRYLASRVEIIRSI